MKMIFLKKSLAKCVGETIPRSFYKKPKLNISLDQLSKVSYNLFLLHAKLKAITKYWSLHCVKSVQIFRISQYSVQKQENKDQKKLRIWTISTQCKLHITYFYLIRSFFENTKKGLELVSLPIFLHDFREKQIILLHSTDWSNFIDWLRSLPDILGNMCLAIVC